MPIFEYHCPDCGNDFEELRNHSKRDEPIECPQCRSRRPSRKISLFASAGGTNVGGGCSTSASGGFT